MNDHKNNAVPKTEPISNWGEGKVFAVGNYEIVTVYEPPAAKQCTGAIT